MATAPGALLTAGPIEIVDLDTSVRDDDGNLIQPDIHNAILGDPVVIHLIHLKELNGEVQWFI